MKKYITELPKKYDEINNFDLRSDLENEMILPTTFVSAGKMGTRWYIGTEVEDGLNILTYGYNSEVEYNEDCKILNLI